MKILLVLTSHDQLGNTGKKTGFWLEEFASPYYAFKDAGADVTLVSPKGGLPPIDPKSNQPDALTDATERFKNDADAQKQLATTKKLSTVSADDYDAVFYAGGHGPLWDLAEDKDSIGLIEEFFQAQKPVAAVCHAPAVLRHAKLSDGSPLVKNKSVTGFSNSEEQAVGLSEVVPFLLQDTLQAQGAHYEKGEDWQPFVVTDGHLITGQNPASSEPAALKVIQYLK